MLGILGVTVLLFTAGLGFIFTLPMSIAAWIMGSQGRNNVATGKTTYGDGLAHAGVVLGIVGVVLGVIGIVVWVVLILSGVDLEELRRDLENQTNPELDQAVWLLLGR